MLAVIYEILFAWFFGWLMEYRWARIALVCLGLVGGIVTVVIVVQAASTGVRSPARWRGETVANPQSRRSRVSFQARDGWLGTGGAADCSDGLFHRAVARIYVCR